MASRSPVVDRLYGVPLFARCSARDLKVVARHMETIKVDAGADIVREGEPGDVFFVVLAGDATVHRGGRKVRGLGPGDYFGELALLDPAPRAATVRATTPMELGALEHHIFRALVRDMPAMTAGLLSSMARELRDAHGSRAV